MELDASLSNEELFALLRPLPASDRRPLLKSLPMPRMIFISKMLKATPEAVAARAARREEVDKKVREKREHAEKRRLENIAAGQQLRIEAQQARRARFVEDGGLMLADLCPVQELPSGWRNIFELVVRQVYFEKFRRRPPQFRDRPNDAPVDVFAQCDRTWVMAWFVRFKGFLSKSHPGTVTKYRLHRTSR